jgi:hypothetical protein
MPEEQAAAILTQETATCKGCLPDGPGKNAVAAT